MVIFAVICLSLFCALGAMISAGKTLQRVHDSVKSVYAEDQANIKAAEELCGDVKNVKCGGQLVNTEDESVVRG